MGQELAGKVAIVTGGARGIGRATAERFAAEGARVVIGDISAEGAEVAARLGAGASFLRMDVAHAGEVQALVDHAVARFGTLDIMFNNAGIPSAPFPDFLDDDLADFERVLAVNLFGTMTGTQRAARHMARHGGGVILNMSSIAALLPGHAVMNYRTAKAAVALFSKSVAIDLARHGIRVNCLAPGQIRTDIFASADTPLAAERARRVAEAQQPVWDATKPLKRQGLPGDVAEAALFLASDRAAQITGIVLPVDGGISAGDPTNRLRELLDARARILAEPE